jgi:hypothetical protein
VKKAFRFGVVTGGHATRAAWISLAQRIEELGYASLLINRQFLRHILYNDSPAPGSQTGAATASSHPDRQCGSAYADHCGP